MRTLRLSLMGVVTPALIGALGAAGAIAQADASRSTDPVGDAIGDAPDIVAATTTASPEGLVLEVELADDWTLPETRLLVWFFPDPTTRFESEEPLPRPNYCNPWFMDMVWIDVTERADLAESFGSGAIVHGDQWPTERLPYSVDERDLRLTIPLATLGDPETLGLHLRAVGLEDTEEGGDHVPDEIETCLLVPLGGEAMPDDATDEGSTLDGQSVSDLVMKAWATGEDAAIEAAYDPAVIMILDGEELATDRDGIASVIKGAVGFGNTYTQVGPVSEYQHSGGDTFVSTLLEVRGAGHPQGDPVVGFYRVHDGKVTRHVFMDAEHY